MVQNLRVKVCTRAGRMLQETAVFLARKRERGGEGNGEERNIQLDEYLPPVNENNVMGDKLFLARNFSIHV